MCVVLKELGVECVLVEGVLDEKSSVPQFDADCVRSAMHRIISQSHTLE